MAVKTEEGSSPRTYQQMEDEHDLLESTVGKDVPPITAEDDSPADHQSKQRIAVVMTALSVRAPVRAQPYLTIANMLG